MSSDGREDEERPPRPMRVRSGRAPVPGTGRSDEDARGAISPVRTADPRWRRSYNPAPLMGAELYREQPLDLREYLAVVRRRRRSIAAIAALTFVFAMGFSLHQTPMFTSTAKVWVKPIVANQTLLNGTAPTLLSLDTEKQLVQSEAVADLAARNAGTRTTGFEMLKHLSVDVPTNSQVLEISYSSPGPLLAQKGAQAFATAYLKFKTDEALATSKTVEQSVQQQIGQLQNQLAQANYQAQHTAPNSTDHVDATNRITTINTQIGLLENQLASINTLSIDPGAIVQSADLPTSPSSPNHLLNGGLGLFLGLALGIGVAFLRERLDDRIRGREDLEEHIGAPVLIAIPRFTVQSTKRRPQRRGLVTIHEPSQPAAEAYRTLRTSLQFHAAQTGAKVFMVVSATPGEGKTTTAANLAVVLAHAGKQVVLLSADMRNPVLNELFRSDWRPDREAGLSNILTGEISPQDTLQQTEVRNLWMIGSGPVPVRPAELASSESMSDLIEALREAADFTIIDSAPSLAVTDALAMAPHVDGVLYVADATTTERGAVVQARTMLEHVGANVIGAVLNRFEPSKAGRYEYSYRYTYTYGPPPEEATKPNGRGGDALRRLLRRT
jgi:polysaccharide biosynthesis transport protein